MKSDAEKIAELHDLNVQASKPRDYEALRSLVTGGSRGIGAAVVRRLAREVFAPACLRGRKVGRWRFRAAALGFLLIAACAPSVPDLDGERARLLQRDAEWAAVAAEGTDVEKIVSYWTDDAVVYPPGMPALVGKDAIRRYVETTLAIPGFRIAWASSDVTLSPDGQLAYMLGKNAVTVQGPDDASSTRFGRGVTVWRREPDGVWRCVVDIWNDEPAGSAEPAGDGRR